MGEFDIGLLEVVRDDGPPFVPEFYQANFEITQDSNSFTMSVWIEVGSVPTVDLIRHAMNLLHLTAAQLAKQTEGWRM
ncbi:hypothetical protein [Enterovirga sp. CN4-39]|uniref:hypothetical protein n=1 Tax=Enterovirga sp. CN4-39 TaxID=3400910 RepID=UPI003C0424EE